MITNKLGQIQQTITKQSQINKVIQLKKEKHSISKEKGIFDVELEDILVKDFANQGILRTNKFNKLPKGLTMYNSNSSLKDNRNTIDNFVSMNSIRK